MEVQILHYNTKYDSPEAAAEEPDGFAALSIFYQMDVTISNNLDYTYDVLPNVTRPGSSHIVRTPFPLALLLPDVTGEFYRCLTNPRFIEVRTGWGNLTAEILGIADRLRRRPAPRTSSGSSSSTSARSPSSS